MQPAPQKQQQEPQPAQPAPQQQGVAAAAAATEPTGQQPAEPPPEETKLRGPWDPEGFAWSRVDAKWASDLFTKTGGDSRQLQKQMMDQEPADGHVSLDHVHQTAKRVQGGYIGMLIAMGASGLVLDYFWVFSTSLEDVAKQLKELDQRQRSLHGKVSSLGWVVGDGVVHVGWALGSVCFLCGVAGMLF